VLCVLQCVLHLLCVLQCVLRVLQCLLHLTSNHTHNKHCKTHSNTQTDTRRLSKLDKLDFNPHCCVLCCTSTHTATQHTLQHNTHCNTPYNTPFNTHCNTLQHTLQHSLQHTQRTLQHTTQYMQAFTAGQAEFSNSNWYELYDKKGHILTAGKTGKQVCVSRVCV